MERSKNTTMHWIPNVGWKLVKGTLLSKDVNSDSNVEKYLRGQTASLLPNGGQRHTLVLKGKTLHLASTKRSLSLLIVWGASLKPYL